MNETPPVVFVAITAGSDNKANTTADLVNTLRASPYVGDFRACTGTYLCKTRNTAVLECLKDSRFTHLAYADCDMRVPMGWLDRLLSHDVDVVGCAYRRRVPPHDIMAWDLEGRQDQRLHQGLVERVGLPTGVFLIARRVLEVTDYPWFYMTYGKVMDGPGDGGIEVNFCDKVRRAGFAVWCDYDLSRHVRHIADMEIPFEIRGLAT